MPDNAASIGDGWSTWLRRALIAFGISMLLLLVLYLTVRVRVIWQLHHELVHLQGQVQTLESASTQRMVQISARLDELERTLFGDVAAKLAKAPPGPNRIELWQRNRDAELRGRIQTLEKRLMRIESEVQNWR